jgi:hypothetical protein
LLLLGVGEEFVRLFGGGPHVRIVAGFRRSIG